jgi:hypothetical protein
VNRGSTVFLFTSSFFRKVKQQQGVFVIAFNFNENTSNLQCLKWRVIRLRIKNHRVRPRLSLRLLLPRMKSHCLQQQLDSDSRDADIKQLHTWVKKIVQ